MGYVKNTWQSGDVVTAAKLNHIEAGIGASTFVITLTTEDTYTYTADKTWKEVRDAVAGGVLPIVKFYQEDVTEKDYYIGTVYAVTEYLNPENPAYKYEVGFLNLFYKGAENFLNAAEEEGPLTWFNGD